MSVQSHLHPTIAYRKKEKSKTEEGKTKKRSDRRHNVKRPRHPRQIFRFRPSRPEASPETSVLVLRPHHSIRSVSLVFRPCCSTLVIPSRVRNVLVISMYPQRKSFVGDTGFGDPISTILHRGPGRRKCCHRRQGAQGHGGRYSGMAATETR